MLVCRTTMAKHQNNIEKGVMSTIELNYRSVSTCTRREVKIRASVMYDIHIEDTRGSFDIL